MKSRLLAPVLLLAVALTGCFSPKGFTPSPPPVSGEGNLIIKVGWEELDPKPPMAMSLMAMSANEGDNGGNLQSVTHVGARLIYPADGAVFTQSKAREVAEQEGVISMRVPASPLAHLFVVAVQEDEVYERNLVVKFGVVRNIVIEEDTVLVIEMDEISWSDPTWSVVNASQSADIQGGEISGDKDLVSLDILIRVHDPFQSGESLDYGNLLIGVAGRGSLSESVGSDGASQSREYRVGCTNQNPGSSGQSDCWFTPYLKGDRFNLDSSHFLPPFLPEFTVNWE